jgi:hypothetical protein
MVCDICAGEIVEMQPLNKLSKLTCRAGHTYSKLKRDGDAYFKTQTDVKKENHEIPYLLAFIMLLSISSFSVYRQVLPSPFSAARCREDAVCERLWFCRLPFLLSLLAAFGD